MAISNKLIEKLSIYGGNYGARLLGDLGDVTFRYFDKIDSHLGHPYTALGFGLWDLVTSKANFMKQGFGDVMNKTVKIGAAAYFGALTIKDLIDFTQGDYSKAGQLPFDASMFYTSVSDLKDLF